MTTRRLLAHLLAAVTVALASVGGGDAFAPTRPPSDFARRLSQRSPSARWSSPSDDAPANLVREDAFVAAIDVLKRDMGLEIIPEDQRPRYAIGKLVARLPLALVSGLRFADCERLTLVSQVQQRVVDATGLQALDTIVAVRAGGDGDGGYGCVGDTNGRSIAETAAAYTAAIDYAVAQELQEIEVEVNRLVPLREVA